MDRAGFDHEITEIRSRLEHASESLRYNPRHSVFVSLARKPAPAALLKRTRSGVDAVDHIVDQISAIARALVDVGEGRVGAEWDRNIARQVGELVVSVGRAVEIWARTLVADDPDEPERPGESPPRRRLVRDIEHAQARMAAASQELATQRREADGPTTTSWLVVGGVLADLSRILAEIDPGGGAHKVALSSTPGARVHVRRPSFLPLRRALRAVRGRLRRRC